MTDVHSKEIRSYNMKMIKGFNTRPEILVRKYLFSRGFRFRINVKNLPGKPDIVLKKYGTIIFINGCFWHGHKNCKYFVTPKTRTEWWLEKIYKNILNDKKSYALLKKKGWNILIIWECQLKRKNVSTTLNKIECYLKKMKLDV